MDVDSGFHSLLRNLKIDGPWTPPKTWESIAAESGTATPTDSVRGPQNTIYDLSSVSEAFLVRLVINALQGVRTAIVEIEKLSISFCSSPADRSFRRVPSLWCRLSSTNALGRMLKTIHHSSLLFFSLREFVGYFLCTDQKANTVKRDMDENCPFPSDYGQDKSKTKEFPPYSLVNQAFACAVGKLLEGYICSLSTLSASIKLRRQVQCEGYSVPMDHTQGTLTSVVHSEMTFMEVYLHTKELRSQIEALGSICFCRSFYQTFLSDALSLNSNMEFHKFPRGANLLSYLYVQFRDADPVHHSLLKYLFVHSYEPYSGFIKLWMYRATIDDPYGEFFIASSDSMPTIDARSCSLDNFSLASMKEQAGVAVPCFLKDVCHQILLAGQQLQVLVKLLDCCDLSFSGRYAPCDLSILRDILPFWVDSSSNVHFLSNPLCFDIIDMEFLIKKREIMYRTMFEKLQTYLDKFSTKDRWTSQNVIAFGSMPFLLGEGSGMNVSAFDGKTDFIHGSVKEACGDAYSDVSSSSAESALEMELSLSSECSHAYNNESTAESLYDLQGNLYQQSKSMFSKLPVNHEDECRLQNYTKTDKQYFKPPSLYAPMEHVLPATSSSNHHHQNQEMNLISFSSKSDAIQDLRTSKYSSGICQPVSCWPLGGLHSNPFYAHMNCCLPKQLPLTKSRFENDEANSAKFSSEEIFFPNAFGPVMINLDGSERMETSICTFKSLCYNSSTISWSNAFSMNPMLTKSPWLPTCNSRDICFYNDNASRFPNFNFLSVTDPCKMFSESLPLCSGHRSKAEASMFVQLGSSVLGLEQSGCPIKETVENQPIPASLCYSAGETNSHTSAKLPNASGGADWTRSLRYPVKVDTHKDGVAHSEEKFLVPLDIILDRCVIQEILLQYKYISSFTIKFLEEGFNLREHLLALRRYHFMEISDWADLFVMSLSSQSVLEHEHEPARIQGLLDMALQRSSCENDPYKERLFICTQGCTSQPAFANGIHAFDFMVLGYQVDWPVNIVVTQGALKIYADIFSYLLQIRLAVTSLTDVWHYLKDLVHSLKHDQSTTFLKMRNFNILMRIRQHLYHFTTTLQKYVHSQLSEHQFQDSLKHMAKYMLDLESVHMLYLTNAVRICFLSDDAKEVATIVKNILQCALDFRLCFTGFDLTGCLYGKDDSYLRSQIKFSQVSIVNSTFKKNLKELYLLHLKRAHHSEFSLHRFWNNLNYNNYYSAIINEELGCSFL